MTIKFTNSQQSVPTVVVDDAVKPNETVQPDEVVQVVDSTDATITTGDDGNMALYGMMILVASAGLVLWTRRNRVR